MTDVSYVPGDRTAIVGDRCLVLVDAPPDSAAVAEIWQRGGEPLTLDALLAGMFRVGFGRVPDFALLITGAEGRRHLICRGRASATVVTASARSRIDGTGLATWLESPVPADAGQVILGEPPAGTALRLPAAAGVLLAGCVVVDLSTAAARDGVPYGSRLPGSAAHPGTVPATASGPVQADTVADPGNMYPDTVTITQPGDARPNAVPGGTAAASFGDGPGLGAGQPPAGDLEYDFLWGATQARTVQDAAVRPAGEDDPGPAFPFGGPAAAPFQGPAAPPTSPAAAFPGDGGRVPGPAAAFRAPGAPPAPFAVNGAGPHGPAALSPAPLPPFAGNGAGAYDPAAPFPGGLIDAVPWAAPGGPAGQAMPSGPASPADGGLTVRRGHLPRPAERALAPDRIGPTVPALVCPSGHVNPPSAAVCRRCREPLPQDPVIVARPVLGVLRLSAGDEIALDRDVVMGRSPRADFAGADGEERPHVVKLPSAEGDISRTHLRVSLDGWHVLVTDLNSTNGTLVTLPGRDPEQLRPGEPTPIQPGTVVILPDGIDFRYEVPE